MKKQYFIFTLLLFVLGSAFTAAAQESPSKIPQRGYAGNVSAAFGFAFSERGAIPMGELSTTHGYQFNPSLFLGAGVLTLNTEFVSFYGQITKSLRRPKETRPTYPFFSVRAGYMMSTWVGEHFGDEKGIYLEPNFGWSFYSKAGKLRYNVYAGVSYYVFSFVPRIGLTFDF